MHLCRYIRRHVVVRGNCHESCSLTVDLLFERVFELSSQLNQGSHGS